MYCIRCSKFSCGEEGLISISMSPNSSVKPIDDDGCNQFNNGVTQYVPGPSSVSVSITAYAFKPGEDKWVGSKCKGQAQASQTNILRYDGITDKWIFLPSKVHRAQITGDVGTSCSIDEVMFTGQVADSQVVNGISITTEMGVAIGSKFYYSGGPISLSIPDISAYNIDLGDSVYGYINSFSLSVDYPNPATVSYSFDCMLDQSNGYSYDFFKFDDC